jgi:hypothetical protein
MPDVSLGLSYWLPRTEIGITITKRTEIVPSGSSSGSTLRTVADVTVAPGVVEDTASPRSLKLDERLLQNLALTINLDDRGFITSINSDAGRDITPVLTLLGKAVGLATTIATTVGLLPVEGPGKKAPTLEKQWEAKNKGLAALVDPLSARIQALLEQLAKPSGSVAAAKGIGDALDVVQSQLASISESRRTWIAAQAKTLEVTSLAASPQDLFHTTDETLPAVLPADQDWALGGVDVAKEFGVVVALADTTAPVTTTVDAAAPLVNAIALRRPRKATLGVYLFDGVSWKLDAGSIRHLDIVDSQSATDHLGLDGRWMRSEKFELAYHPDMSLKTFGFSTTSTAGAAATSAGGVLDALGAAQTALAARPSADQKQLAAAKTQLDLLTTQTEFEALAATRGKATELAVLEQQAKIAAASA